VGPQRLHEIADAREHEHAMGEVIHDEQTAVGVTPDADWSIEKGPAVRRVVDDRHRRGAGGLLRTDLIGQDNEGRECETAEPFAAPLSHWTYQTHSTDSTHSTNQTYQSFRRLDKHPPIDIR
jgi:hypothetical protein